jgi:hypothetical protein
MLLQLLKTKGLLTALMLFVFALSVSADELSSCGNLDSENTVYALTQNVSSSGTCFTIAANNVTLDCQGHMINYSQSEIGYGVYSFGNDKIVIKNCNIIQGSVQNDSYTIYVNRSLSSVIYNNNLTNSGRHGIGVYLITVLDSNITNNNLSTHGLSAYAVIAVNSSGNRISNNIISVPDSSSRDGIFLGSNSSYNIVANNLVSTGGETGGGVDIYLGTHNTVLNNTIIITNYMSNGIEVTGNYSNLMNNIISMFGDFEADGIYVLGSFHNITGNIISVNGTGSEGIYLYQGEGSNISNNSVECSNIYCYGIHISGVAFNNTISDSTFTSLQSYAVYMGANVDGGPFNNTFYNNLLKGSLQPVSGSSLAPNFWNTTNQSGARIYSVGSNIGGNYYTNPDGTGFSDTCTDANDDKFCDEVYDVYANAACTVGLNCGDSIDYLPYSGEGVCELSGNNPPCLTVSLREVVDFINLWIDNEATLSEVVRLINAWANSS